LLQRLLGTQRLADRPAAPNDVSLNAACDLRSSLIGPVFGVTTGSDMQTSLHAQLHTRTERLNMSAACIRRSDHRQPRPPRLRAGGAPAAPPPPPAPAARAPAAPKNRARGPPRAGP